MAKILVEFDTVAKTLSASMDGKSIADVYGVNLYRGYADENEDIPYRCELTTRVEDHDNKMLKYTSVIASDGTTTTTPAVPAKPAQESAADDTKLSTDVEKYFENE